MDASISWNVRDEAYAQEFEINQCFGLVRPTGFEPVTY